MPRVKHVTTCEGDWSALYIDGEKFREGHSIDSYEWIEAINHLLGEGTADWGDYDDLLGELDMWGNRFPQKLEDLESEIAERLSDDEN